MHLIGWFAQSYCNILSLHMPGKSDESNNWKWGFKQALGTLGSKYCRTRTLADGFIFLFGSNNTLSLLLGLLRYLLLANKVWRICKALSLSLPGIYLETSRYDHDWPHPTFLLGWWNNRAYFSNNTQYTDISWSLYFHWLPKFSCITCVIGQGKDLSASWR